jgi:hypothetical protein
VSIVDEVSEGRCGTTFRFRYGFSLEKLFDLLNARYVGKIIPV